MTRPVPLQTATAASSPADLTLQAAPALPLRRDDDAGFPIAGVGLLLVLLAVALWAWRSRLHGTVPAWRGGLARALGSAAGQPVQVTSSVRLDATTRLHVVSWNGRELLVAINGTTAPVVLERRDVDPSDRGARQ